MYRHKIHVLIVALLASAQFNVAVKATSSEQELSRACQLHPRDKNVWYQLGKYQFDQGKFDDSFSSLQTASLLDPLFYSAIELQAEITTKLNRYQEARMLARRLIHIDPKNQAGFTRLLDLCLTKPQDKNEASWIVRLAKSKAPDSSQLFLEIGKRFAQAWQTSPKRSEDQFWHKLASDSLNQCLKLDPTNKTAQELLAKLGA
jgi:cytochrome c-type biogenesis protein CcmH/NrfG